MWNSNKINLHQSFDFWFNVFLGCKDADGADGIVFILQPLSTSVGNSGGGMGFGGVQPSIGIALDTWQNSILNDPVYDHISIQANGVTNHGNDLAGPVPMSATSDNVEDCKWHVLRIVWDAGTKTLSAYFDGSRRVETQVDLVRTIFNNDPMVYWGFTGATGGAVNLQQFCTALNPLVTVNNSLNGGCVATPIQFADASESFAPIVNYNWSFGDGTFSTEKNPPPHTYPAPGRYPVNLKITGQDGCEKDSTFTVTVGSIPAADVLAFDTCFGFVPRYQFNESNIGVSYQWKMDDSVFSTSRLPSFFPLREGQHKLEAIVTSDFDCGPPAHAVSDLTIKPLPKIEAEVADGCVRQSLFFNGRQTDNETIITQWQWRFGDGGSAAMQNTTYQYGAPGPYSVKLWAQASNGCVSDTAVETITINAATAFAGRDTSVIEGVPLQLSGSGNGNFSWSPAAGLSDPTIANPVVTLSNDQQFVLTVTTAEGCTATDAVLIKTFKGPAIYVPSAFTPNGDGKNDRLKPTYVGIKDLRQFAVYNRWGQVVFSTREMNKGWEGRDAPSGTYVWMVQALDAANKNIVLKGTVTIIR